MGLTTTMYGWGAATHTSSGVGTAIAVGSYWQGQWLIRVLALSGTNPRLRPSWQSAAGSNSGTASPFGTLRSFPTLLATGVAVLTLTNIGAWGRPAYAIGGTGANLRVQSWFVGKW